MMIRRNFCALIFILYYLYIKPHAVCRIRLKLILIVSGVTRYTINSKITSSKQKMNSKTLIFVLYLLLVVVNSKPVFRGRGFQTQTSKKKISKTHHPASTTHNENENYSSIEGNNGKQSQNVLGFLKWKLKAQLKVQK